jgi:hypothetical protein
LGGRNLGKPAGANFHLAKIRVVKRHILPHEAKPAAAGAVWVTDVDTGAPVRAWLRGFGFLAVSVGDKVLEIFQARFEWFHG